MRVQSWKERWNGFTLVEVLIVIVIIGILAGAMMLASFSATEKAQAVRICAEIRSMKTAAIFYYNDEGEWPTWLYTGAGYMGEPDKYMDREPVCDGYWLGVVAEEASGDRVAVILPCSSLDMGVKRQLAKMAQEMGYYKYETPSNPSSHTFPEKSSLVYFGSDTDYDEDLICFICPN